MLINSIVLQEAKSSSENENIVITNDKPGRLQLGFLQEKAKIAADFKP